MVTIAERTARAIFAGEREYTEVVRVMPTSGVTVLETHKFVMHPETWFTEGPLLQYRHSVDIPGVPDCVGRIIIHNQDYTQKCLAGVIEKMIDDIAKYRKDKKLSESEE